MLQLGPHVGTLVGGHEGGDPHYLAHTAGLASQSACTTVSPPCPI